MTPQVSAAAAADPHRLPQLDALRGLAALYVVLYHVMAMPQPTLAVPEAIAPLVGMGGTGVVLFFVMSAFSLCLTWPRHAATGLGLRSFYLSRLFRIAPLLLALLALMLARDLPRAQPRYGGEEIAWNLSMLFGLSRHWQAGIVMGSWTIGVEMLFYAFFPLIALYLRHLGAQLALLAGSYLLWLWASAALPEDWRHFAGPMGLLTHLPLFVLGCVLFQAWPRLRALRWRRALGHGLTGLGLALLWATFYRALPAWPGLPNAWYLSGLGYGSMLMGLLLATHPALVNRATCFLGTISYSLYLVHPFVVSRLYGAFARCYAHLPEALAYLACAALSLALAVPAAWLTYRCIEKPGIRLGHRLFARLRARRAGPADAQAQASS